MLDALWRGQTDRRAFPLARSRDRASALSRVQARPRWDASPFRWASRPAIRPTMGWSCGRGSRRIRERRWHVA